MSGENTFEVHVFAQGGWRMESIYDDKELAVAAAKLLVGEGGIEMVRVAQEVITPDGKRKYRVVFNSETAPKPAARKKAAPAAPARRRPGVPKGLRTATVTANLPRRPQSAAPPRPKPEKEKKEGATQAKRPKSPSRWADPAFRKHMMIYGGLGGGLILAAYMGLLVVQRIIEKLY